MSTKILVGDCRERLKDLPDESVHCVVTSPPYWGLRDYGLNAFDGGREDCEHQFDLHKSRKLSADKQSTSSGSRSRTQGACIHCGAVKVSLGIGLEPTFEQHLENLVAVFREVRRVLRNDGTCWLNYGDAYCSVGHKKSNSGYGTTGLSGGKSQDHHPLKRENNMAGLKHKDLMLMPVRVALALQADGWWVRSKVIWHKNNPMPESVTDRPTNTYEEMFLLSKSGDKLFWTHRAFPGVRVQPEPDYVFRLWEKVNGQRVLKQETPIEPPGWRDDDNWKRVNLWVGHDYFYDAAAVCVPYSEGSLGRYKYALTDTKAQGHQPGVEKAVETKISAPNPSRANLRNVWKIPTQGFSGWQSQIDLTRLSASQVREHAESGSGAGGDMARITSPDCPVHAGRPDLVPTGFCDGLGADQLRHMRDTFRDHAQARVGAGSGNGLTPDHCRNDLSTTGSCVREDSGAATLHSSETHRMDPAPASSSRATASAETDGHTGRTEPPQTKPALTDRDTDGYRTEGGTSRSVPSNSSPRTADRSPRTSKLECACLHYTKVVSRVSHFATFPEKLVEPCIKAGTSAEGACEQCGAPWVRVVGRLGSTRTRPPDVNGKLGQDLPEGRKGRAGEVERETTGWSPTCECEEPTVPCTVLDPFGGAGTVALVAERLRRNCILIELSPEYAEMSKRRILADCPPLLAGLNEIEILQASKSDLGGE